MRKLKPEEQKFIDKLYDEHYDRLLEYAMQFLEETNAEEAVQNVFVDACIKIDKLMIHEKPNAWLGRALQYSIKKIKRNKRQFVNLMINLPDIMDWKNGHERGIGTLPSNEQIDENVDILYSDLTTDKAFQLIKKYAVEDKSIKTIAEEEQISVAACKKRLSRAKFKLKKLLKK